MPSENFLSSLSAYSGVIASSIAFGALALTDRGGRLLSSTGRRARVAIQPRDGTCETRFWSDALDGPLHQCGNPWQPGCHGKPHVPGSRCWELTLEGVINHWDPQALTRLEVKSQTLPVVRQFLHVDLKVILGFIFMTAKHGRWQPEKNQIARSTLDIGSAKINIQKMGSDLVLLHLEGQLERMYTKDYVHRLLDGYPPLLKDPRNDSVVKKGDEKRGGWIVAIGLVWFYKKKDMFLPVYSDCVEYKGRRGRVFWRSMDRVRHILVDIWAKAFAADPTAKRDIDVAIRALEYVHEHETESGVEYFFDFTMPRRALSSTERANIIDHFNGPPLIPASQEAQFRAEWAPLLPYVLLAAVRGSTRCIAYFKNPGRELEHILPMDLLKSADLYLRDC